MNDQDRANAFLGRLVKALPKKPKVTQADAEPPSVKLPERELPPLAERQRLYNTYHAGQSRRLNRMLSPEIWMREYRHRRQLRDPGYPL